MCQKAKVRFNLEKFSHINMNNILSINMNNILSICLFFKRPKLPKTTTAIYCF